MNKATLIKIIDHLKSKNKIVDNEDISYFPERYSFSLEEFYNLHDQLGYLYKRNVETILGLFSEKLIHFEINAFKFIWRRLCGQGTACQFVVPKEGFVEFNEDKKVILDEI